ncbi:hypothetical protein L6452_43594 [Arctium lappa]|uniref:Uncharacterized protein n=1 Tax=Arctium lappa TaxID=4217 RepID=A0ACB8XCY9_ARCLA|nr:hypothetical protein L6452_43594 [Arctium lappa]
MHGNPSQAVEGSGENPMHTARVASPMQEGTSSMLMQSKGDGGSSTSQTTVMTMLMNTVLRTFRTLPRRGHPLQQPQTQNRFDPLVEEDMLEEQTKTKETEQSESCTNDGAMDDIQSHK